jgi:hypothetical protein
MREELEQQLVTKFPELFGDRNKPPTETLICFGCDCDDGWFDLIYTACQVIQNHMEYAPETPPFRFSQIKEKFGGLRLYHYGGDDFTRAVCTMAEALSYKVCELTGDRGQLCSTGFWLRTLSPAKAEKHGYTPIKSRTGDELENEPEETTDGSAKESTDSDAV